LYAPVVSLDMGRPSFTQTNTNKVLTEKKKKTNNNNNNVHL